MTTTATKPDPFGDFWMPDYCPCCNPLGDQADSRIRSASMNEPDAVTWHGGKGLVCDYLCERCGHQWRRADLWTAKSAGIDLVLDRSAA